MNIIEFYTSDRQAHWLEELQGSDWSAGQFLYALLRDGKLKDLVGQTALVPMLVDEERDKLVSFCTLAPLDDIQPTELSPWIGFVYTFPEYRGKHYAGQLLSYAESIATVMGKEAVYISTAHTGLYEKYGYQFYEIRKDLYGEDSRVYRKLLQTEGAEKALRLERGNRWKAELVARAKEAVDPVAVCGFSCGHCFLGQWCGGCRSVFCCCSYGTLSPLEKCPNLVCCREKGLDGCYDCPELEGCQRGFYAPDNDGAAACKAQALFLRRHGKAAFLQVQDRLHRRWDFRKTQEILGQSVEDGLDILESAFEET